MSALSVLTFTDKPLSPANKLVESCNSNHLDLDIISPDSEWKVNAQKIKLLNDYLKRFSDDSIILVVDAFDVYINASSEQIRESFLSFGKDILFSAEANFYFRNPKLKGYYLKNYPKSPTVYQYLNSGTFIGYTWAVKKMLQDIISENNLDPHNMDSFIPVRSDQYLYGKHFVDHFLANKSEYSMALDYEHKLMEVAGGRMRLMRLPHLSKLHSFNSYKIERFLAKLLKLNQFQNQLVDMAYDTRTKNFLNTTTGTKPTIIHLPGSWQSFNQVLSNLMDGKRQRSLLTPVIWLIGLLAYLVSLLVPVKINY